MFLKVWSSEVMLIFEKYIFKGINKDFISYQNNLLGFLKLFGNMIDGLCGHRTKNYDARRGPYAKLGKAMMVWISLVRLGKHLWFITSSHRKDNDASSLIFTPSKALDAYEFIQWQDNLLDSPPKRYLVGYHALSSDRVSQEELKELLLNQSRDLIQGFSHVAVKTINLFISSSKNCNATKNCWGLILCPAS